jgi:hypothetical protein
MCDNVVVGQGHHTTEWVAVAVMAQLKLKLKFIYDLRSVGRSSGAHDQIFIFCLTIAGLLMCGTLSDERTGL